MAIGDAHREQIGSAEFELAARLLGDPDLAWTGRQMVEQAQKQPSAAYMEAFLDPLVTDLSLRQKRRSASLPTIPGRATCSFAPAGSPTTITLP